MKQTIDLIFKHTSTGPARTDKEGCAVRVEDILSKIYRLAEGRRVLVRIKADDVFREPGTEEPAASETEEEQEQEPAE